MSIELSQHIKRRPGLAVASFLILFLVVFIIYRYDQLGSHGDQLTELQDDLTKLQNNLVNSAQLERQLDALKKINRVIESTALRPADLARNSQYFYTLEADHNIKLLELQQQPLPTLARGATQPLHVPLKFTVNVAGEYEQILKFMREIEVTFLGGKILSASISPGGAAGKDPAKSRLVSMVVQTVANTK